MSSYLNSEMLNWLNKCSGGHKIVEDLYPVYVVEILTNRGTIRKAIPTDRLKKTSKCIEPVELELNS